MSRSSTQKMFLTLLLFSISLLLFSADGKDLPPEKKKVLPEELPMFGGERSEEQKKEDEKLITWAKKKFGSREKACRNALNLGWKYFAEKNYKKAMLKFNQAWLMKPENAEVYWGFGTVLARQNDKKMSISMLERAASIAPNNVKILVDLGALYSSYGRALEASKHTINMKLAYGKANTTFAKAFKLTQDYPPLYVQFAVSMYYQKQYSKAWKLVLAGRKKEAKFGIPFIKALSEKMPEPDR